MTGSFIQRTPVPVGPSILWPENAQKSQPSRGYIDRHMRDGLGHIHKQERSVVMADLRDFRNGRYHAKHVGRMGNGNEACRPG